MDKFKNYIGGKWASPSGDAYAANQDPAHKGQILGEFPASSAEDVDRAVEAASKSDWAEVPGPERGKFLYRFADKLDAVKEELGRILTREQGKPLRESVGEVARAATEARYMAGEASRIDGRTLPSEIPGVLVSTIRQPVGVVAAITPWNFPVVTPVRKIAPALACGNTVVFKPASDTPWSAWYLTKLFDEIGLPAGALNLVMGSGRVVGERLSDNDAVRAITFTGSTEIGTALNQRAAQRMVKMQLELGGKNPSLVYDYPNLDEAAASIVAAAFACSGQRCTAISRVIIGEEQADELTERIIEHTKRIKVGDGLDPDTTMGPLVSQSQLDQVRHFVAVGQEEGAELLFGGETLTGGAYDEGFYHQPTVFGGVSSDMTLAQEEIFGPVLPIIRVASFDEAVAVANKNRYGLAASVFTRHIDLAAKFALGAQVGMVHINHGTASQAQVPFGGVKSSGMGAYSIGHTAKDFFCNDKVIYTRMA